MTTTRPVTPPGTPTCGSGSVSASAGPLGQAAVAPAAARQRLLGCHPAKKLADARPARARRFLATVAALIGAPMRPPPAGSAAGELLYQEGAVAAGEAPPFVLAKGPELPFTAGAPLAACGPSIDDYQLFPGVSPFLYGSFPCQGSIRCVGQQL